LSRSLSSQLTGGSAGWSFVGNLGWVPISGSLVGRYLNDHTATTTPPPPAFTTTTTTPATTTWLQKSGHFLLDPEVGETVGILTRKPVGPVVGGLQKLGRWLDPVVGDDVHDEGSRRIEYRGELL
jgi:hypothetical protein